VAGHPEFRDSRAASQILDKSGDGKRDTARAPVMTVNRWQVGGHPEFRDSRAALRILGKSGGWKGTQEAPQWWPDASGVGT